MAPAPPLVARRQHLGPMLPKIATHQGSCMQHGSRHLSTAIPDSGFTVLSLTKGENSHLADDLLDVTPSGAVCSACSLRAVGAWMKSSADKVISTIPQELACCRFLRPGGAVLPDQATMYVAGAGPGALDLDFWQDVYGFSYR